MKQYCPHKFVYFMGRRKDALSKKYFTLHWCLRCSRQFANLDVSKRIVIKKEDCRALIKLIEEVKKGGDE